MHRGYYHDLAWCHSREQSPLPCLRFSRLPTVDVSADRSLFHVVTKMQKEENRAVMGLELLWAVCGLKGRGRGHPWGAYEGASSLTLMPASN